MSDDPPTTRLSVGLQSFSPEPTGAWDAMLDWAARLDEAGVDRLVVSDHVVFGDQLDDYGRPELGGQAGGRQPTGPDGAWLDPLTTLAFVAARTTRIRLGTSILLAALRRPVVLAKTAATLDVLSGGRLDLGVGVGWQRAEYDAAGLPFAERGRRLDHTLEVCRTLWREPVASFRSAELSFEGIHMMPKPVQPGGVPLWISGTINPNVVRRLARFGSGWIPWGPAAADLTNAIPQMRDALADAGRDPTDLQVVGHLPVVRGDDRSFDIDATMAAVPELVAAGVTDVRLSLRPSADASADTDLLHRVVHAFADVTGRLRDS
jgi:probable F420-dependent oxidoreductase